MGVRIIQPAESVLYDSDTGLAFGPIFRNRDEAELFLQWWKASSHRNLLRLSDGDLRRAYCEWLQVRDSLERDAKEAYEADMKQELQLEAEREAARDAEREEVNEA